MPTKKPQNAAASQSVAETEVAEAVKLPAEPRKLSLADVMDQYAKPPKPVAKQISFIDQVSGSEVMAEVWIKRLSFGAVQKINQAYKFELDESGEHQIKSVDGALINRERIAQTICRSESGELLFTDSDQVAELVETFASALFIASDEVNNFSGK